MRSAQRIYKYECDVCKFSSGKATSGIKKTSDSITSKAEKSSTKKS